MWRSEVLRALADYASVLADCLAHCSSPGDRASYVNALAFVGILLGRINDEEPLSAIEALVEAEDKNFGWTYLSEADAKVAEEAWSVFKAAVATAIQDQSGRRRP
jgi:hypothetical protein